MPVATSFSSRSLLLGDSLYRGQREDIYSVQKDASGFKQTNSNGPMRVGLSGYRPSSTSILSAKYGFQSKLLDELLVNHSINAYEGDGKVYCEIQKGGKVLHVLCENDKIMWEEDEPHGSTKILPFVLLALSEESSLVELKDAFIQCVNDYQKIGTITINNMLLFNDSFYYGYAKNKNPITVDACYPVTYQVRQAINTGLLKPMDILKNIPGLPKISVESNTSTSNTASVKQDDDYVLFEKAKAGELIIPYQWGEDRKHKIPPLTTLDDYVPCDVFYSILRKIKFRQEKILARMDAGMDAVDAIGNDYVNIFITGLPGTGKTTLAYKVAAALGYVIATMSGTRNTDSDEFEGKTKVVNGKLDAVDTDFLDVYANGGIIVVEEVNMIDTNVLMGTIGQAIEPPFVLKRQGYETIRRHPMCVAIHTMNVGTAGSRIVNEAYSNRSKSSYLLNDTKRDDAIKILTKKGFEKKACEWAYDAYMKVYNWLKSTQINKPEYCPYISIRTVIGCLQNMEEGDSPEKAFIYSVIGKINEVDTELAEQAIEQVVKSLRELR